MTRPSHDDIFAALAVGDVAVTGTEIEHVYDNLERLRVRMGCQYRVHEAVTGETVVRRVR